MISEMKSGEQNRGVRRVPPPVRNVPVSSSGKTAYGAPDYPLLVITMALTCFGIIMVFSASGMLSLSQHKTGYYILWKELIWVAIS
ncbi:MAG: hypothetical protein WCX65_20150, partial [bacterium]